MDISFTGKRALVTGASRGIGRDIAKQLAQYGAKVIAVGRNKDLLASLKEEVSSITIVPLDVTDWNATKTVLKDIGPIDLLVNNAGVARVEPLTSVTEEQVNLLFDTNVKAVINITQTVVQGLLSRKAPGSIVNLSSLASTIGFPNFTAYCATKGALDAFTRAVAVELGPSNIRVNNVNPTVVMTDMAVAAWTDPEKLEMFRLLTPLRKIAEVQDVVDAVLFLLSDRAKMITGTCLMVDGGLAAV